MEQTEPIWKSVAIVPEYIPSLILFLATLFVSLFCYNIYFRPRLMKALTAWALATATGVAVICSRELILNGHIKYEDGSALILLGKSLLGFFLVPLLFKLYGKWTNADASLDQNNAGPKGIRGWLRGGNLFCCIGTALCLAVGFGLPFLVAIILPLVAILFLTLIENTSEPAASAPLSQSTAQATADFSAQRERVLKLLEEGKITAPESTELLNALGESAKNATCAPRQPLPSGQKLSLIGGGLLLLAFFLPWFSANLSKDLASGNNPFKGVFSDTDVVVSKINSQLASLINSQTTDINVNVFGGDIQHGFGWLVLFMGIGVAVLPYMAIQMNHKLKWNIACGALGIGTIVLLYLLSENLRHANIGIILATASYALILVGSLKQHKDRI